MIFFILFVILIAWSVFVIYRRNRKDDKIVKRNRSGIEAFGEFGLEDTNTESQELKNR